MEGDTELIFIHSHDALIEKRLGDNETIVISKDALVAFTERVKIQEQKSFGSGFLKVQGPGLLYLETSREQAVSLTGFILEPSELTR